MRVSPGQIVQFIKRGGLGKLGRDNQKQKRGLDGLCSRGSGRVEKKVSLKGLGRVPKVEKFHH